MRYILAVLTAFIICLAGCKTAEPVPSAEKEVKVATSCFPSVDTLDGQPVLNGIMDGDIPPQYPGGQGAMNSYILKNLIYPAEQKESQSKIYLTFIVDTSGQVRNECIYKLFYGDRISPLENELLKIIKTMPRFAAANRDGRKFPFRYSVPLTIDLK